MKDMQSNLATEIVTPFDFPGQLKIAHMYMTEIKAICNKEVGQCPREFLTEGEGTSINIASFSFFHYFIIFSLL